MNTIKTFILLLLVVTFSACSSDDDGPKNHAPEISNMTIGVSEDLTSDLITTVVATDLDGDTLIYSIVSQTPANSVIINETTGEIYVGNASTFDYEQNTTITVTIMVSDGELSNQSVLTINILDVNENG